LSLLGCIGRAAATPSVFWVLLGGLGSGASLALSLAFFSLRTHSPSQTASLSGMAQSGDCSLVAPGPLGFGLMHDASGGWRMPLAVLWVLVALQSGVGALAARARRV
jgi:CP family cyanate transporter-like MFS transporter